MSRRQSPSPSDPPVPPQASPVAQLLAPPPPSPGLPPAADPPSEDLSAGQAPQAQPVEAVEFVSIESGLTCPACGRDMVPRIRRTRPEKQRREGSCTLCGASIRITYRPDGRPLTASRC